MRDARMFSKAFTKLPRDTTSFGSLLPTLTALSLTDAVVSNRNRTSSNVPFTNMSSRTYKVTQVAKEVHTIHIHTSGHHGFFRPRPANGGIHSHRTGWRRQKSIVQAVQLPPTPLDRLPIISA